MREGRDCDDVNLRMSKGPENVLPHDGGTARHEKEVSVEQPVDQKHDQARVQDRQSEDDEKGIDENHPGEERQPPERHVRRALQRTVAMKLMLVPTEPIPEDKE